MEGLGQSPGARVRPKSARDRGCVEGAREREAAAEGEDSPDPPFLGCFFPNRSKPLLQRCWVLKGYNTQQLLVFEGESSNWLVLDSPPSVFEPRILR